MHKNIIIFITIFLLLTSCWTDKEIEKTKNINNKAIVPQTTNIESITPKNINPEKESNKNLIENPKLSDEDKEKFEKLKNSEDNFYLFNNDNINTKISEIQAKLEKYESWEVYKINSETNKFYTQEEYKTKRFQLVDFEHPDTWEKNKEKQIDAEIFVTSYAIETDTIESFSTYIDDEGQTRKYKTSTSARLLRESNNNNKELLKKLIEEKKELELWNIKKYITLSKEDIDAEISSIKPLLEYYKIQKLEWESILAILKEYKTAVSKGKSIYNPEEVKYIFNNVLNKNIELDYISNIKIDEAKSIISQFESGNLVKLTKKLPSWMNISSDILYSKIINNEWMEYYIDEKLYINLKHSITVWWEDFILYEDKANSWYQYKIYSFLTGYNPNQSYYQSLSNLILEKWNIEIHKSVFTIKTEIIKENWLIYNLYSGDKEIDVNKNWMLTNLLLILTGKKELNNKNITISQLKDFLTKLF